MLDVRLKIFLWNNTIHLYLSNGEINMTKAEILTQIKQAEEDAKSMISEANDDRAKQIADARAQGKELINKAETEASKKGKDNIAQIKEKLKSEKAKMLDQGLSSAESIKSEASEKVEKATEYLVEQFERAIHA